MNIKEITKSLMKRVNGFCKETNVDLIEIEDDAVQCIYTLKQTRDAYQKAANLADAKLQNILRAMSDADPAYDPVIKD